MNIYPISGSFINNNCRLYTQNAHPSFTARNPQKEIKTIGDEFVKRVREAKNREEFYTITREYLKEGVLPSVDDTNLRSEIVNRVFPEMELSFAPGLIPLQNDIKHVSLREERKHFAKIVKIVNKITSKWYEE